MNHACAKCIKDAYPQPMLIIAMTEIIGIVGLDYAKIWLKFVEHVDLAGTQFGRLRQFSMRFPLLLHCSTDCLNRFATGTYVNTNKNVLLYFSHFIRPQYLPDCPQYLLDCPQYLFNFTYNFCILLTWTQFSRQTIPQIATWQLFACHKVDINAFGSIEILRSSGFALHCWCTWPE